MPIYKTSTIIVPLQTTCYYYYYFFLSVNVLCIILFETICNHKIPALCVVHELLCPRESKF